MVYWRKTLRIFSFLILFFLLLAGNAEGQNFMPLRNVTGVSLNPNSVLRIALVGRPSDLNPLTAGQNCASCRQIIDLEYNFGLPVFQNGSSYSNGGIFDWISSRQNSSIWDVNIRPGAIWSDGAPVTSADVNFTFTIALSSPNNSVNNFLDLSTKVKSILTLNSSETEFVLNGSETDFGSVISNQFYFPIVPAHIWQQNSSFLGSNNFGQDVTDGPFFHLTYNGGSNLILRANPESWIKPSIGEINVTFVSSENDSAQMLESNQTDLGKVDPTSAPNFASSPFSLDVEPQRSILFAEYNISSPLFNNTAFRQAVAYGINTSAIVQNIYHGYATPGYLAEGGIPPTATAWHNVNLTKYPYNVTLAQSLLEEADYTFSANHTLLFSNGSSVSIGVFTDTDSQSDSAAATSTMGYLKALGIQTWITYEPATTLADQYASGNQSVRNGLIIISSNVPVFGFGTTNLMPGSRVYFPWAGLIPENEQSTWLEPPFEQSTFKNLENLAINYSGLFPQIKDQIYAQAVQQIDLLNSKWLPVIVLAYPDALWAYRTDRQLSGFPQSQSIIGIDMGGLRLDPDTLSQITCGGQICTASNISSVTIPTYIQTTTVSHATTTNSPTSSASANTGNTSQTTGPSTSPANEINTYEIITIVSCHRSNCSGNSFE